MTAQRKAITRKISAKDREFERLLRRAARYAKLQAAATPRVARSKHVAAA